MFKELENTIGEVNSDFKPAAGFGTIEGLANGLANLAIGAGISIAIIFLAYGFIQFLLTEGDPKRMQTARNAVLWSIVAFFAAAMAAGIKSALFKTVGM
jgi:hypothetical protein